MNPDIINSISNIYQLIAWGLFIIAFIIMNMLNKNQHKKKDKELTKTLAKNNQLLVERLEELKGITNNIDLQSSFDIIEQIYKESMWSIAAFLIRAIIYNNLENEDRQNEIKKKLKAKLLAAYEEDKMILDRIYYKNRPLSRIMGNKNKMYLFEQLTKKLFKINSKNRVIGQKDMIDFLESTFKKYIQEDQLKLTK